MHNSACFLLLICLFETSKIIFADNGEARWCTVSTQEANKCITMKTKFAEEGLTPAITCVNEATHEACMASIANGRADLITLDGGDVFTGGRLYGLRPIMEEIYADGKKGYNAIAVVKKSNRDVTINNLRGKSTCHTGYGRNAGWNIPVGFLLEEGKMPSVGCQSSLQSASHFFNLSCAPGVLEAAKEGSDVHNLCSLCPDPDVCSGSGNDYSARYMSAFSLTFKCMIEREADVAFIKTETVLENTDGNNQEAWAATLRSEDFEILCRDGTRRSIAEEASCNLATAPSHAVVTAGDKSKEDIDSYIQLIKKAVDIFAADGNAKGFSMFDSEPWSGSKLLFKDATENLRTLNVKNYEDFLGVEYLGSMNGLLTCPADSIRFCTVSSGEQKKCEAMSTAFSDASISPNISCFQTKNHAHCMAYIAAGNADIVTLDGGDIYKAGKYHALVPLLGETYGEGDASYWAVAVVRANTTFTINDLQGKKSCHTGIMKTAGWVVPVGYLSDNQQLEVKNCDSASAIGEFFSQSCAPGALKEEYNPLQTEPASLCSLCIGQRDQHCVRNDHEPYYDYSGALRCLAEGAGDVAFIKHLTVDEYAGDNKKDVGWNANLKSSDFHYLCPDGTRQETWSEDCSLSKVSAHALMTSGTKSDAEKSQIKDVFLQGQKRFGSDDNSDFKLFDSEDYEGSDLLFKDSTASLVDVGNRNTYDTWLSKEYLEGLKKQDPKECSGSSTTKMTLFGLLLGLYISQIFRGVA
uniref:Melanotransferrin 3 n=1 Tax=Holothuria glaberrima TaxID=31192 RepID=A0A0K1Z546_HOLGL|nr:melanotransferrin 3 [Holothuria glaberrima]